MFHVKHCAAQDVRAGGRGLPRGRTQTAILSPVPTLERVSRRAGIQQDVLSQATHKLKKHLGDICRGDLEGRPYITGMTPMEKRI